MFETISQSMYDWIVNILFGELPQNTWYTNNLDVIRGITTVIMCAVVVLIALWLVVAVVTFLGRLMRL